MGSPEKPLDVEMGDMSEEAKLNPDVKASDDLIKENGKVADTRFTGLKKEELMKISQEPQWVRARWVLFILFWVAWVGMLVGAIVIVVNAPRCKEKPKPQWYQDTIVYEVNPDDFAGGLEGTKEHLPYIISNLHAYTILLTGVAPSTAMSDPTKTQFSDLVMAVHDGKGHIVMDVEVDSLPTTDPLFRQSATAACAQQPTNESCDLFIWQNKTETMSGWAYDSTRGGIYKITESGQAIINYAGQSALPYIKKVIREWLFHQVNGVKIRDISKLDGITSTMFLQEIWDDIFKNETDRALFVYSSDPDAGLNTVPLDTEELNTVHSPVLLTAQLTTVVNQTNSGSEMTDILKQWREQSRNIGGFVVTPVGMDLAAERFPNLAAGLHLLSMALPGVPILRSGDEILATSPKFEWSAGEPRASVPVNGSSKIFIQTKELIVRRVEGIQSKESLRFDTRDNDTVVNFLDPNNDAIFAFTRKWDKKSAVLVVSNMSPVDQTGVNLVVEGGLMKEGKLATKGKVLVTSHPSTTKDTVNLAKLDLKSGATLVVES